MYLQSTRLTAKLTTCCQIDTFNYSPTIML